MKLSIQRKLFLLFTSVLLFNIIITLLFGNSFVEQFYIKQQQKELLYSYEDLNSVLNQDLTDHTKHEQVINKILEIESQNMNILVFQMDKYQGVVKLVYFTKSNLSTESSSCNPQKWISIASNNEIFAQLDQQPNQPILNINSDFSYKSLDIYGKTNSGLYVFLETPQEQVALAANLTIKYNLYISLLTFILGVVSIYFISKRITQPIHDIDRIANRISHLNFSEQCKITTGDELETLGDSINSMATRLQQYIDKIEEANKVLERDLQREAKTNEIRREFIANVSHDFKTPLSLISAYAEALKEDNSQNEEYCEIIIDEAKRMNQLVTQLLNLSKLESGIVSLELSFFSINELLGGVLYSNQLLLQQKQIQTETLLIDEPIVIGDYFRVEQVIVNLVDNAIKYTPAKGKIIIKSCIANDHKCRISIINSAPPLSEQEKKEMFTSFYKGDKSRHSDDTSFGLGLAIVKAIIGLHGQEYGVNNVAEGIELWFELDLWDENMQ